MAGRGRMGRAREDPSVVIFKRRGPRSGKAIERALKRQMLDQKIRSLDAKYRLLLHQQKSAEATRVANHIARVQAERRKLSTTAMRQLRKATKGPRKPPSAKQLAAQERFKIGVARQKNLAAARREELEWKATPGSGWGPGSLFYERDAAAIARLRKQQARAAKK